METRQSPDELRHLFIVVSKPRRLVTPSHSLPDIRVHIVLVIIMRTRDVTLALVAMLSLFGSSLVETASQKGLDGYYVLVLRFPQ